ncbi:MAG: cardiolipin synthase [Luteolibacter sp.]
MLFPAFDHTTWLGFGMVVLFYAVGLLHVLHALMTVRTSQGTIAWVIALLAVPFVAIPLYWLLGRSRFSGYVRARRAEDHRLRRLAESMHQRLLAYEAEVPDEAAFSKAALILGGLPFMKGNSLDLLIDGEETFHSLFEEIAKAQHYLCVNFYIVKNDRIGKRFQQALIERSRAGVKVYFLFDEIGSHKLPHCYLKPLRDAGVICCAFGANRLWLSRLQLNFRNHRKIVVIDGRTAFLGGLNVGDEYLGRDQRYGKWRDTHLKVTGPAVHAVQMVFLEDWFWATSSVPELSWETEPEPENQIAAIIPTGPADPADTWQLVVAQAANSSKHRLWITSPYFVPDEGVLTALQTAALRGVDVRIMLPERADHLLVWLSAFSYYENAIPFGVKLYRYHRGFLHQKVILVDEDLAMVSTANLDNRSIRLNFEITALSPDSQFIREVREMLEEDFNHCSKATLGEFTQKPFLFRAACRAARLLAPVQ